MNKLQEKVKDFCQKNNLNSPIELRILDVTSELGEVAKEILKMSSYGKRTIKYSKAFKDEIGDLFYSLITVANFFDINLEDTLFLALSKYEKRLKKGTLGSLKN